MYRPPIHGGQLSEAALLLSGVTTNNVSTTKHGFVPKAPNDLLKFLRGDGTWAVSSRDRMDRRRHGRPPDDFNRFRRHRNQQSGLSA
jgi:hypothetical protein